MPKSEVSESDSEDGSLLIFKTQKDRQKRYRSWPLYAVVLFLVLTNTFTLVKISRKADSGSFKAVPSDYARLDEVQIDRSWKYFAWNTEYSSKNRSESDALWNRILPSHGFVAMDTDWSSQQHWPDSMRLPKDPSKNVYLLEAYHQLHCLQIIRKTFWEAVEGQSYTHPPSGHMRHCFDAMLQYIRCGADSTPLYTFGDFTAGDGQLHKCRDWNQLREFATKHTACYVDTIDDVPLGQHFGACDDGQDGLF